MLNRWLPLPLALTCGVLGFLWARDRAEFEAETAALRTARDSSTAALEWERTRSASVDAAAGARIAQLVQDSATAAQRRAAAATAEDRAEAALATAGGTLAASLDTLERRAPPELQPLVLEIRIQEAAKSAAQAEVTNTVREQLRASDFALSAAYSTIAIKDEQLGARDRLLASFELAMADEIQLREHFEREANRGFLLTIWKNLPSHAAVGGALFVVGLAVR